jgi:hypothetical protein
LLSFIIPVTGLSSTHRANSALHATATAEKFAVLKKAFPVDADVPKAGGWYNLQKLAADPKQELVDFIVSGLKAGKNMVEFASDEEKLEALTILLYGMGKGFEADLVDGDWASVFSRQGKNSPKFQKLVGKKEKAGFSLNTYDIESMTFSGDVKVLKKGLIHSTVKVRRLIAGLPWGILSCSRYSHSLF